MENFTSDRENSVKYNGTQYSRSLQNRCESPLVLMNNLPPRFDASSNRTLRSPQPRLVEDRQRLFESKSRGQEQVEDFGQLPKRTVSLGPKRLLQQQQQQQKPEPPIDIAAPAAREFKTLPRFQRQDSRERAHSFNRVADALQSSLTELNNLIDAPQTPKIASDKTPKFTSYLTEAPDDLAPKNTQIEYLREASTAGHNSPEAEQTIFDWRADLMNWKASTSMNDLRSMFESKPKTGPSLDLPPQSSATLKPVRSASPNFLKNSPWQNLVNSNTQSTQPASNTNLRVYPGSDYTIRRTISTQDRSNVSRNPYRSHYGQY